MWYGRNDRKGSFLKEARGPCALVLWALYFLTSAWACQKSLQVPNSNSYTSSRFKNSPTLPFLGKELTCFASHQTPTSALAGQAAPWQLRVRGSRHTLTHMHPTPFLLSSPSGIRGLPLPRFPPVASEKHPAVGTSSHASLSDRLL